MKQSRMDVSRIQVRTKYSMNLNQIYNVDINDNVYRIKVVEDEYGPKRITISKTSKNNNKGSKTEDSSEEDEGAWNMNVEVAESEESWEDDRCCQKSDGDKSMNTKRDKGDVTLDGNMRWH